MSYDTRNEDEPKRNKTIRITRKRRTATQRTSAISSSSVSISSRNYSSEKILMFIPPPVKVTVHDGHTFLVSTLSRIPYIDGQI